MLVVIKTWNILCQVDCTMNHSLRMTYDTYVFKVVNLTIRFL